MRCQMSCLVTMLVMIVQITSKWTVDAMCHCQHHHTQDKICNATFVGVIRITTRDMHPRVWRKYGGNSIISHALVFEIYKDEGSHFRKGMPVDIFSSEDECKILPVRGIQLISAQEFHGGLLLDACSLRESSVHLGGGQRKIVRRNVANGMYERGCRECKIKKTYDPSYVKDDECRPVYEFPRSVSACVADPLTARCEWARAGLPRRSRPTWVNLGVSPPNAEQIE